MPDPALSLAILAGAVVLQTVVNVVAAAVMLRAAQRARTIIDEARDVLAPLSKQAGVCLQDLHDLSDTVRRTDRAVRTASTAVRDSTRLAARVAGARAWPLFGALRAARAFIAVITQRLAPTTSRRPSQDELDEARFVNEGGPIQ